MSMDLLDEWHGDPFGSAIAHDVEYGAPCSNHGLLDEDLERIARDIVQGKAWPYRWDEPGFGWATSLLSIAGARYCPFHTSLFVGTKFDPHAHAINGVPVYHGGYYLTLDEHTRLDEIVRPMLEAIGIREETA